MKKLLILALGAVAVVACKQQGAKTEDLMMAQQADSLNRIIQQKDNEINDMMATFNEIEEGFRAINAAQDRVTLAKDGEGANRTQRIRDNIAQIQETMQHNRELINKLKNQLRQSSVKGDELRKTIENLAKQMEEKDKEIAQLRLDLKSRDIRLAELGNEVADLTVETSQQKAEISQKAETISAQDKQLNTAWFVFGTKSELKEQHIIENGKVLQSNFNREYFTKIDIRVDKEIKLYSRSAQLLTAHPSSSYQLERDANKQYVLRITNPQLFWSTSKYLVVLVK
jgi:chromosome segregation ATPase